jgi:hypothetical protein
VPRGGLRGNSPSSTRVRGVSGDGGRTTSSSPRWLFAGRLPGALPPSQAPRAADGGHPIKQPVPPSEFASDIVMAD